MMLEQSIRSMAVDGMWEWLEARHRRYSTIVMVAAMVAALVLPPLCYACTPAKKYKAYCSTVDKVKISDYTADAIMTFNNYNNQSNMRDNE